MERQPDFVIDLQQHSVSCDGERVALPRKSYDLLVFFVHNPERLLTKDAILRGVWPDTHVTEGSVKDTVKQLRRALSDDPANPRFIATERGLGYRFLGGITILEESEDTESAEPVKLSAAEDAGETDDPAPNTARTFATGWVVAAAVVFALALGGFLIQHSRIGPGETASAASSSPKIAVMPFANLSADPDENYFAEGMTDDLITDLSQISGLFVIARNSTEVYASRVVPMGRIAEELGVRYLLQGSVRRSGDQLRINAQLVDTESGKNLWAERFDGSADDVLALQTDIARKIVSTLEVTLSETDAEQLARVETSSAEAHDHALRGHQLFRRLTPEDNAEAKRQFEQALEIDPEYARAETGLGWSHWMATVSGWDNAPLEVALAHAEQALALNDRLVWAYALRGKVYLWQQRHEEAEAELHKAVALVPSDYSAQGHLGDILVWSGKPDEAFVALERSLRLSPNDNGWIVTLMGLGHFFAERNDEALQALDRALVRNPDYFWAHLIRAAVLGEMDRQQDAHSALNRALAINPEFSIDFLISAAPFSRDVDRQRLVAGLRSAGLED